MLRQLHRLDNFVYKYLIYISMIFDNIIKESSLMEIFFCPYSLIYEDIPILSGPQTFSENV